MTYNTLEIVSSSILAVLLAPEYFFFFFFVDDESISSDEIDEESSPPLRKQARADPSETENSLQDVKHLLQVLCEKVESNEKTLKELRHSK